MLIIPAVDLHQGKCVRLTQGKLDQETVYSNDPVFVARLWQAKGAKRLHLVDLDGAHIGSVQHWDIIKEIRKNLSITIQFGGGVRNIKTVEKLVKIGIDRIIISTMLITSPEDVKKIVKKIPDKIIAAVDIFDQNNFAIGGWKEKVPIDIKEFLTKIKSIGIEEIIVTDINVEGMLQGIDIDKINKITDLTNELGFKVIISGGVTSLEDIKQIKKLENKGIIGVIIGKALYAQTILLEDALKYE